MSQRADEPPLRGARQPRRTGSSGVTAARRRPRPRAIVTRRGVSPLEREHPGTRRTPAGEAETTTAEAERRARMAQWFWSLAVVAPAVVSVFRLVVAGGGELQTTLLLVANVNPVNLMAAFVINSAATVTAFLILLFAIGSVVNTSVNGGIVEGEPGAHPLITRWAGVAPPWFQVLVIAVAMVTWPALYLPLLFLATVAIFQISPARLPRRGRSLVLLGLLGGYLALVFPTVADAARQHAWMPIALLMVPPALALAINGPVHPVAVWLLSILGPLITLSALAWAMLTVVTTPFLPLTVTTIAVPAEPGAESGAPPASPSPRSAPSSTPGATPTAPATGNTTATPMTQNVRGNVVQVDDIHAAILLERGGVRYVPVDDVLSRVHCPSDDELPRYRLYLYGLHIEDSLLQAVGRWERSATPPDPACRATS